MHKRPSNVLIVLMDVIISPI
ncbi:unnamed protein product [Larinioides sclopetarius]|uniref:Uncharacterized protein n=1 Tax=Larinioides sclopetarius TaxID=280406 RepID=A0AAV2B6R9_9ARAC